MTAVIDLSRLPAPAIVEALDFETILSALTADALVRCPSLTAVTLESEPARKILEACAYRELILRQRVNDAARAVMLAYSAGPDLAQIGGRYDVGRLDGEEDDRLRARIQQGYHLLAAAGPTGAYRAHAMAAHAAVRDVSVYSPADGQVAVVVLAYEIVDAAGVNPKDAAHGAAAFPAVAPPNGQAVIIAQAGSAPLLAVQGRLLAEEVRPLTDVVVVRPPAIIPYEVRATLTLYPGPDTAPVLAQSAADLDTYQAGVLRIGYDVTRAGLLDALVVPGIQNVQLDSPAADLVAGPADLILCTSVALQADEARTQ